MAALKPELVRLSFFFSSEKAFWWATDLPTFQVTWILKILQYLDLHVGHIMMFSDPFLYFFFFFCKCYKTGHLILLVKAKWKTSIFKSSLPRTCDFFTELSPPLYFMRFILSYWILRWNKHNVEKKSEWERKRSLKTTIKSFTRKKI